MSDQPTIFIIDDDPLVRDSTRLLVKSMGGRFQTHSSAADFLERYGGESGCVVSDVRMAGMTGLQLLETLAEQGFLIPVILITAFADIPTTVRAIQQGAVTVLRKPCADSELWEAISTGLEQEKIKRRKRTRLTELRERIATLTPGEETVMNRVVKGEMNKAIATELGVSLRTVEQRRSRVLKKMKVQSIAELVRCVLEMEFTADDR
ncbi:MAG: response regulator [Planctomycetales bacterium]